MYISTKISALIVIVAIIISANGYTQPATNSTRTLAINGNAINTNTKNQNNILLKTYSYDGETLPLITLNEVPITAPRYFKNDNDRQAYDRLKRNVRKAYPYAVLASIKLKEYDAILNNIPENKRAPYLRKAEKELKDQFASDLKNLTMSQGRILIRLINRETGMTTYTVIKDYRGGFSAFMWQSLGLLWGNNLKWKYDPSHGEDKLIEGIIHEIQDSDI